jgi:hypothetical protein
MTLQLPFQVGDVVIITIPQENREWGYNPCPDGSKALVLGYGGYLVGTEPTEHITHPFLPIGDEQHGPKVNASWVRVMLENGKIYEEFSPRLQKETQ